MGKVRTNNEDHYMIARFGRVFETIATNLQHGQVPSRFEESAFVMAVADGMGGMAAGEVASSMAITIGANLALSAGQWNLRLNEREAREMVGRVSRFFRHIDRRLTERAESDPQLSGMGTTLTTAYSVGDDLFLFHVGDSRAYLFRDGGLAQITHDQTLAQALADSGRISAEEVGRHHLRHVLTHALGKGGGEIQAEIQQLRMQDGDRLLLCTDGLTDMVDDAGIAGVLSEVAASDQAGQALIERALEAGGKDNVTVVVARYHLPARDSSQSAGRST
jgi:protein phosphatase